MIKQFDTFLESVDLGSYREKYRPIKIVEMDLPKGIQAISALYEIYWVDKKFISFDDFYVFYLNKYKSNIEEFRNKIQMCEVCFYKGLPARIYRTWASLITQIHAGYVAESVFGEGTVSMSEDLDHRGIDFQVRYSGNILNYQVKKETFSREVRKSKNSKKEEEGLFVDIMYNVPSEEYFKDPRKKDGEYRKPYLDFMNNKNLRRFNNGFVVFTPNIFQELKAQIDTK